MPQVIPPFMKIMGSKQSQPTSDKRDSSTCSDSNLDEESDEYLSLGSDMETFDDSSCAFTADAAHTITSQSFNYPNSNDINLIEDSLDQYEKISMVYLLYDDAQKAYDILQHPLHNAIQNWCQYEGQIFEKWNWKLLEALTIIKNYKVLRMMGYKKVDMMVTFLPNNESVSLYVNVVRKTLFCIFENLDQDCVDKLMFALQRDLTGRSLHCYVNRDNLELTFLHLEKNHYISLKDLTNLYHLFKSIDMLTVYEHLKAIQNKLNVSTGEQPTATNRSQSVNSSFSNDDVSERCNSQNVRHIDHLVKQSVKPINSRNIFAKHVPDTEDCYHIDPTKPGLTLVINNEDFYTEYRNKIKHLLPRLPHKLDDRTGTEVDKNHLQKVFEALKYKVIIKSNVTHDKIKEVIKECIKKVEDEDFSSFFVAILSHGDKGVIYGCNSIPVEISDIQETLYSPSLCGKPKVLLIQACQGEKLQEIDEEYMTDGNEPCVSKLSSPRTSDVLVFYATIPNYSAIRHPKKGTWFIQSLCEKIRISNKDHFEEICLKVKQDVANKRWGKKVMVALTTSTLTKKLYLTSELKNVMFPMDSMC